jgi:Lectin C-type domain
MSFDNARAECNKLKMDLVRAQTPEENMCIQMQIAEQGEKFNDLGISSTFGARVLTGLAKEFIWMGLNKTPTMNYTQWVDAKPLTYTDWDVGNPADPAEDCAMFL